VTQVAVGGGCINEAVCLEGDGRRYFVKLNTADRLDMFEAEAAGLDVLHASGTVRVPRPLCLGAEDGRSWLVLEFISLGGGSRTAASMLGEQLAAMHRCSSRTHGWDRDNTIGATPQPNAQSRDWVTFYREQRLGYQLELAASNGAPRSLTSAGERLLERLEFFFQDYRPEPSLLHGDLWGGNWACDGSGRPVIFDPAVYYGDRETDIAMTELFGRFEAGFYRAYQSAWPLDSGYASRKTLYQLYHILNHFNLFGGGYAGQAGRMLDALLSQAS
jgi:fructosamine-3-kinase